MTSDHFCSKLKIIFGETYKSKIFVKNPEKVCTKVAHMAKLGLNNIQVLCDFDSTLSKYNNGLTCSTSYGIFEANSHNLHTREMLNKLTSKYEKIERDQDIPVSIRSTFMKKWWNLSNKAICESKVSLHSIPQLIKTSSLTLRKHALEYLMTLHKLEVPVVVFSAGIGDVIEFLLKTSSAYFNNIRIVSNFMNFNEEGILVGFHDHIIHSLNKNISSLETMGFGVDAFSNRPSVLLLGDVIEDVNMTDGLRVGSDPPLTVLRIGFLNFNVDSFLEKYMDAFDIVLIEDETFDVPIAILNWILSLV